ncbi:hypothetical protein [Megalodesulfovibrio gigas]|uniref:Lipoprotein n=1 Tax=Megalodesulfovibrio gigas (strain ATCC 19364 / DSM 1382 / NCIMB 9332 / VKM B-1759) TaxID=1121448 RepID=T2GBD4_MEGG1|nr:hypothetical protein [Megalodesulfovibrio gigas]AGW13217.1 hypothetical protein DGI_1371 [Megalodesulfovibrio gigas DSM 1382 = ATCC 19364]
MKHAALLCAALAVCLVCVACGQDRAQVAGRYAGSITAKGGDTLVFLTLREDGGGEWQAGGETVSFRWELRDDAIWLHAKSGGVVAGRWGQGTIAMELPGLGPLRLHKE